MMLQCNWLKLLAVFVVWMVASCYAASPLFLQAIQSALSTIPFTGFPMSMTAGLAGAKLAVGAKLLYYLGFFGRRGKTKAAPVSPAMKTALPMHSGSAGGFMPLPYTLMGLGGGFPGGGGFAGSTGKIGGFPGAGSSMGGFQGFDSFGSSQQTQFTAPSTSPSFDPGVLLQALTSQGINPLQLMAALESAGIDPDQMLKAMGSASKSPQSPPKVPQSSSSNTQFFREPNPIFRDQNPIMDGMQMPHDVSDSFPPRSAGSNEDIESGEMESGNPSEGESSQEDIESFFNFLKDMDDNKCISRLICDIGADPSFLGEFTQNIDGIISSLEVPPGSGATEYIEILEDGRKDGGCAGKFTQCNDEAYEMVKSVAPSVGVPNIGQGSLNSM